MIDNDFHYYVGIMRDNRFFKKVKSIVSERKRNTFHLKELNISAISMVMRKK